MKAEIQVSFDSFFRTWKSELDTVSAELNSDPAKFLESYTRLVSLNKWRSPFLSSRVSEESMYFFIEALNDGLYSHVLASLGAWRVSLKTLRSCIENTLNCLYYKDHPVELALWKEGKHRTNPSELFTYLRYHPIVSRVNNIDRYIGQLESEYSVLSRAVHGSGETFRMTTENEYTTFWTADAARLGMWQTRERAVVASLNVVLVAFFHEELQGNSFPDLRNSISLALTEDQRKFVREGMQVSLEDPV